MCKVNQIFFYIECEGKGMCLGVACTEHIVCSTSPWWLHWSNKHTAGCVPGLNPAQEHFISLRSYSSFTSCWYCILAVPQLEVLAHQMCINPLLRLVPNNTLFAPVGVDLDKKHSVLITLGSYCQQEQRLTTVLLNWRWWSDFPLPS